MSITSFDSHMFNRPQKRVEEESDADSDYNPPTSSFGRLTSWLKSASGSKKPKRISFELLELEDKVTGNIHDFRVYQDEDLPMLNSCNEASALFRKNIIVGNVDDDCQTDDDQKEDAKRMLRDEVKSALSKFLQDKKDGILETSIKNWNVAKRFAKIPFHLACTE